MMATFFFSFLKNLVINCLCHYHHLRVNNISHLGVWVLANVSRYDNYPLHYTRTVVVFNENQITPMN